MQTSTAQKHSFTARALAVEAILAAITIIWLHRNAAPRPQPRNANP